MITILSLNVRGLNAPVKRQAQLLHLRDLKCDICLLQETHLLRQDWKKTGTCWFDRQFHSWSPGPRAWVARNLPGKAIWVQAEISGRLLLLQIDMQWHNLTMANVYGPNEHQECYLKDALGRILVTPDEDTVVGRDFNIAPDPHVDRSAQGYGQTGAFLQGFQDWLGRAGLTDIWRRHHPADRTYSFFSAAYQTYARIDLFLTSPRKTTLSTSSAIGVASISDHSLFTLSLTLRAYKPSK
ncbi:hypothetical protein NDU88_005375 [Pleurodeles waltl]|uniref:exodeoxyribonuclease III n=1 Tax=Pleurodeles waltl TaxID=8319 RepID=A0AAV7PID2_PLEWA|nr:hypothetical protein NDU88_005375 [Pleurodeles waltl]